LVNEQPDTILPLLGDLSDVPPDYIADVAGTKRFLERWVMDPRFRDAYRADPEAAIASLRLTLRPEQVNPLIDDEAGLAARREMREGNAGLVPVSVRRYWAFGEEKIAARARILSEGEPAEPRLAAWRRRQVNRCIGELGLARSAAIVHAPAALELAKGCTVGCWFCGVAAPKLDHTWHYTPENAELWRATLGTLRDVVGPCVRHGFLYWATDPLDNPDYERFVVDFFEVLGRCPQTTTALGQKDIDRTRRLLQLSSSLGSFIDRFSIVALNSLYRIHEGLSAEELLRVECIPQNREAGPEHPKANVGRARTFAHKRKDELVPSDDSSTIACVSGFLFNMPDRSVKLITPCNVSDRWPLGYWVLGQGSFDTPAELRELLLSIIGSAQVRTALRVDDVVRLRPDIRVEVAEGELRATSLGFTAVIREQPDADDLAALLSEGSATAAEIALRRESHAGVPLARSLAVLGELFDQGLLDEEPAAPEAVGSGAAGGVAAFPVQAVR